MNNGITHNLLQKGGVKCKTCGKMACKHKRYKKNDHDADDKKRKSVSKRWNMNDDKIPNRFGQAKGEKQAPIKPIRPIAPMNAGRNLAKRKRKKGGSLMSKMKRFKQGSGNRMKLFKASFKKKRKVL